MFKNCILPVAIILISFSGCSITEYDNPINNEELEVSNEFKVPKGLDFKDVIYIGQELSKVLGRDHKSNAFGFSMDYSELQIEGVLNPFVKNGRIIHQQLLDQINASPVWNTLSEDDKQSILSLSDQELAELSFIISVSNQITSTSVDGDRIRSCVAGVIGVGAVKELVKNTAALASAEVAAEVLILVGKRTLGWVALGWMIWDFYDCIK